MRPGLVVAAACALVVAGSASAAPHDAPGRIVFSADRSPLTYGEIYRVDLDGTRVDLSRSPAADVGPAVSPDGKLVAFASNRGGRIAVYVVRIDGTGLRRVSPAFPGGEEQGALAAQIAWTRDGRRIAADLVDGVTGKGVLWIGDAHGQSRVAGRVPAEALAWSRDGTALALQPTGPTGGSEVDVMSPAGTLRWTVRGDFGTPFGWSAGGRLAVGYHGTTSVYDAGGRRLAGFRGSYPSWSPDGPLLATVAGRKVEVRRGGLGAPTVDVRLAAAPYHGAYGPIEWLGDARLRADDGSGFAGVDVAHDRALALPAAYAVFGSGPVSADGRKVVVETQVPAQESATLGVAAYGGATGPVLATGAPCTEQPWWTSEQFTPGGTAIVYQTACGEPSADLYSIGADGTGLQRLTDTPVDETQPAWSPDGSQVAYVEQPVANKCDGCPDELWTLRADGTAQHALTTEKDGNWDVSPTWSPDGRTVLFAHETYSPTVLRVVPASGGTPSAFPAKGSYPSWGPTKIAVSRPDTAPTQIQTVLPDGSGTTTVAHDGNEGAGSLAWSRDGRLAYLRIAAGGRLQLVVVGHAPVLLGGLTVPPRQSGLAWSPDGTRLAVEGRDAEGVSDVWLVDADGTHLTRLTHGLGAQAGLSWTP